MRGRPTRAARARTSHWIKPPLHRSVSFMCVTSRQLFILSNYFFGIAVVLRFSCVVWKLCDRQQRSNTPQPSSSRSKGPLHRAKTPASSDQARWPGDLGRAKRSRALRPTTTRSIMLKIIPAQTTRLSLEIPRTSRMSCSVRHTRPSASYWRASTCT